MVTKYKVLCLLVISVLLTSFTESSGEKKIPYELHVSSIESDSIVLCLNNNTSEPAYLFDSYLNEYDISYVSYIHRYNKEKDIIKVSFLPFQQYVSVPTKAKDRKVILGEERYLIDGQIYYHFTKINAGDSLAIYISKKTLTSDRYYYDVDLREYTHLEKAKKGKKARFKKNLKLKQLKEAINLDEITIELAVYRDIDFFLEKELSETLNYKYIGMGYFLREVDEVTASYDIVTCTLNLNNIIANPRTEF